MDNSSTNFWTSPGVRHGLKVATLMALLLLMLIPLSLVRGIVDSREALHSTSLAEVTDRAGGAAFIAGPLLRIPVDERELDSEGVVRVRTSYWYAIAKQATLSARVEPELLRRGLYEVPVYRSVLSLEAVLPERAALAVAEAETATIRWEDAQLLFGIPRLDGLRTPPVVSMGTVTHALTATTATIGDTPAVGVPVSLSDTETTNLMLDLTVNGGGSFSLLPTAARSVTTIESDWPTPGFRGRQLPSQRTVTADGFSAQWESTALGLGLPLISEEASGRFTNGSLRGLGFGVELYQPVDRYQRVLRAVKYGALFLLLPFVAIFLMEVSSGRRIHPIQYLLIAAAKVIFYLVLLSVSEQLAFAAAYWIASAATIGLLAVYLFSILAGKTQATLMVLIICAEYLFLYSALISEEYALLIGSTGLFLVVAVTMLATRRIDWYAPQAKSRMEPRTK